MLHYDARRWSIVFRLRGSVLPRVALRVVLCAAVGVVIWLLKKKMGIDLAIPPAAHAIVAVALGLLLVFRTNASYDRFWEGRKLIGGIVNRTRNLVRQATVHLEGTTPASQERKEDVRRLTISLYIAIRQYLRDEKKLEEYDATLKPEERDRVAQVAVPPQLINTWISGVLARAAGEHLLSEQRLQMLEDNLTTLCDLWGGAERIHKTPLPFAYAHHIKGFLLIFCLSVPFALLDTMGSVTPIAAAVVAYGLFGIEEIGVEIEDPFGHDANDLPLDAVEETIRRDVGQTSELGARST
jgi:putative membrane protein